MDNTWVCKPFSQLSTEELYAILRLRNEVFVVEQNCPFQDADNYDQQSWHLMLWKNNVLAAYSRLVPAGIIYEESSIGRIITNSQFRNLGLGKQLISQSIEKLFELFGKQIIRIGAQLYLKKFYESFGFKQIGAAYIEDGIDHIHMLRTA